MHIMLNIFFVMIKVFETYLKYKIMTDITKISMKNEFKIQKTLTKKLFLELFAKNRIRNTKLNSIR